MGIKTDARQTLDWRRAALGAGVGLVMLVTACAASAGMIGREVYGLEGVRWSAVGALVLAGVLAAKTAGRAPEAAAAVIAVAVVLWGLNALVFDGEVEGLAASVLVLAGSGGAVMLLKGPDHGRSHRRRGRKIVKLTKENRR